MREGRLRRQAALAAVVAVFIAGCGGGDPGTVPTRLQVRVFATPPSIPVSGTSTIIAQVTTDQAQPASGHTIEWSNSMASLSVRGAGTDASGRTTATLRGDGTPGVAVITASVVGTGERGQVEVRIGLD
jgi:hypothetical protein